jgi:hypothetical protein
MTDMGILKYSEKIWLSATLYVTNFVSTALEFNPDLCNEISANSYLNMAQVPIGYKIIYAE